MIVAAHQPAYWPWLGYLHKMANADLFVVMDDLQYEAQNFQNRNRLKTNQGGAWITVPLIKGGQRDLISEKRINNRPDGRHHWQRKTWRTILCNYSKAPYFKMIRDDLEALYTRQWESLLALDLRTMELLRDWFDITTPMVLSSELMLCHQRSERIIDLCQKVGARHYLSGKGGSRQYLELDRFRENGIEVIWQEFTHPRYTQRHPELPFIPNLSALDFLMNAGPPRGGWQKPVPDPQHASPASRLSL